MLTIRSRCTSVFHRAVRVRFVPHEQDFLKNLLVFFPIFPVRKNGRKSVTGVEPVVVGIQSECVRRDIV